MELFANNAASTLSGSLTNSATTLTVTSASAFPTSGNFVILVDSELLLVTAVSGTTFTVTRGLESTSAVAHASGAPVTHILSAGTLPRFRKASIGYDTLANRPAAGNEGALYFATDNPNTLYRDNGSSWDTLNVAHTNAQALLGSDTSCPVSTVTDLVSISLAAGTWLITAQAQFSNPGGAAHIGAKIYYGSTDLVAGEVGLNSGYSGCVTLTFIATLTSTQTVKLAADAQSGGSTQTAKRYGGADCFPTSIPGTYINAVRIA